MRDARRQNTQQKEQSPGQTDGPGLDLKPTFLAWLRYVFIEIELLFVSSALKNAPVQLDKLMKFILCLRAHGFEFRETCEGAIKSSSCVWCSFRDEPISCETEFIF